MRPVDFFDKQNGTTNGLDLPQMTDSDRNLMRSLQHEACWAHCDDCNACIPETPLLVIDVDPDTEAILSTLCDDCHHDLRNAEHGRLTEESE